MTTRRNARSLRFRSTQAVAQDLALPAVVRHGFGALRPRPPDIAVKTAVD